MKISITTLIATIGSLVASTQGLLRGTTAQRKLILGTGDEDSPLEGVTSADPKNYPYFVKGGKTCGGTLIANDILLTAGHCLPGNTDYWDGMQINGAKVGIADYRVQTLNANYENDIALIKLDRAFPDIEKVVLNRNENVPVAAEPLTAIGHGKTYRNDPTNSPTMNKYTYPPDSIRTCQGFDSEKKICLKATDTTGTFNGDSGGPLLTASGVQVGIISAYQLDYTTGAIVSNVNMRVSEYMEWIDQTVCELSDYPSASCARDIPLEKIAGEYKRLPVWNGFHEVTITAGQDKRSATWTNHDGFAWPLEMVEDGELMMKSVYGEDQVTIYANKSKDVTSLVFHGEHYYRVDSLFDRHDNCASWGAVGECSRAPVSMAYYCTKTCAELGAFY